MCNSILRSLNVIILSRQYALFFYVLLQAVLILPVLNEHHVNLHESIFKKLLQIHLHEYCITKYIEIY